MLKFEDITEAEVKKIDSQLKEHNLILYFEALKKQCERRSNENDDSEEASNE